MPLIGKTSSCCDRDTGSFLGRAGFWHWNSLASQILGFQPHKMFMNPLTGCNLWMFFFLGGGVRTEKSLIHISLVDERIRLLFWTVWGTVYRDSSTRFFTSGFFHESTPYSPWIHILRYFQILFRICRNIRFWMLFRGVWYPAGLC